MRHRFLKPALAVSPFLYSQPHLTSVARRYGSSLLGARAERVPGGVCRPSSRDQPGSSASSAVKRDNQ